MLWWYYKYMHRKACYYQTSLHQDSMIKEERNEVTQIQPSQSKHQTQAHRPTHMCISIHYIIIFLSVDEPHGGSATPSFNSDLQGEEERHIQQVHTHTQLSLYLDMH